MDGLQVQFNKNPKDINLKELFSIIKKRLWLAIVMTIITTGIGAYYSQSTYYPIYQTSSKIIVNATPENRSTLQVIMKDPIVLDKVVKELRLPYTPEILAGHISVESIDNSQIVSITVTDSNAEQAAQIANACAQVFEAEIPKIMENTNIRLFSDAKVKPYPINPKGNKITIISAIIGLVVSLGIAFLLESLDDTLRSSREVEELLEIPVLGRISKMNKKNLKTKYTREQNIEVRGETIGYK